MSCPSGHILKDNMCTIAPTMTCPTGYKLMNGMCQPGTDDGESEITGFGDSMNIPPTQNGILSQTLMSDTTRMMAMEEAPPPSSPMMIPPASPTMMDAAAVQPPKPVRPPSSTNMMMGSPVSPMSMNNCPSGYSFNRSDNMCYPL